MSVEQFLKESTGSKYPAVKFKEIGQKVVGTVADEPRMVEGTDFNGNPQMNLVLALTVKDGSTVVTGPKGEEVPVTVGETYSLWIAKGSNQARATAEAVGAGKLTEGDDFGMVFTELGAQPKNPAHNRPKLHVAQHKPATASVSASDLF